MDECILMTFNDSHCHLSADTSNTSSDVCRVQCRPSIAVVYGTHPRTDWRIIEDIIQRTPGDTSVVCGFGVHPWWCSFEQDNGNSTSISDNAAYLLTELERLLVQYPSAAVGEIGIDTATYTPLGCGLAIGAAEALQAQKQMFEAQMALAAKYKRSVSVHVVGNGSYGYIFDYFSGIYRHNKASMKNKGHITALPPAVIFHGFCGSSDFAKQLLRLYSPSSKEQEGTTQLFFGIGPNTTLRKKNIHDLVGDALNPNREKCISVIPPQCILLESDAHYYIRNEKGHVSLFLSECEASKVNEGIKAILQVLFNQKGEALSFASVYEPVMLELKRNLYRALQHSITG
eukprot:Tbor_TRINITY_DN4048_c0_g1::TRINITY_DN4048_c0_g1_i2::g.11757::m.11757/K03424/tatD; TatD DNase family protein